MFGDGLMDPHGTTVNGNQECQTISMKNRIMLCLVWKMRCGMIWRLLKGHIFVNVMPSNKNLTNTLYELKLLHICKGRVQKKRIFITLGVFFPLKIPKHLEKFQKIGVGNAKCHANCYKCWSYCTK